MCLPASRTLNRQCASRSNKQCAIRSNKMTACYQYLIIAADQLCPCCRWLLALVPVSFGGSGTQPWSPPTPYKKRAVGHEYLRKGGCLLWCFGHGAFPGPRTVVQALQRLDIKCWLCRAPETVASTQYMAKKLSPHLPSPAVAVNSLEFI